jgi:uncharacterized phage protein (TIGR02218 family)
MSVSALDAHLATGVTGVARCWRLTRRDGSVFGFTDHDCDLAFDGTTFRAGTGLSAAALSQTTGLAVDNGEAVGALSDASVTEADIAAGRFDGAEVEAWLVQWADPENRVLQFRGSIGEVSRANGAFTAELRGLAEALNVPMGRVYQKTCPAVLGGARVRGGPVPAEYGADGVVASRRMGGFSSLRGFRATGRAGSSGGQFSVSGRGGRGAERCHQARHLLDGGTRRVELWDRLRAEVQGDLVRLTAGLRQADGNLPPEVLQPSELSWFSDIPGDDWLVAHPTRVSARDGGSRR